MILDIYIEYFQSAIQSEKNSMENMRSFLKKEIFLQAFQTLFCINNPAHFFLCPTLKYTSFKSTTNLLLYNYLDTYFLKNGVVGASPSQPIYNHIFPF